MAQELTGKRSPDGNEVMTAGKAIRNISKNLPAGYHAVEELARDHIRIKVWREQ
jgi:hypothetical protein